MSEKAPTGLVNPSPAPTARPSDFGNSHEQSHDYDLADEGNHALTERGMVPIGTNQYIKRDDIENKGKVKLKPMSPLAASSTVVNLLLATGPFT